MSGVDALVQDYLRRLDRAAAALPPDRRRDLLEEISEHIAAARASGAGDDEAAVRTVLDRLGEPEEIVAAAREDVPYGWGPPPVAQPRGTGHELAAVLLLTAGSLVPVVGWLAGVVLLWTSSLWRVREKVLGTLVVPLGPGVALFGGPLLLFGRAETCTSTPGFGTTLEPAVPPPGPAQPQAVPVEPVGPPPDPPFPPGVPVEPPLPGLPESVDAGVTSCEVTGLSPWIAIPLTLLLVVAPVVVAVVLYRIARRRAAQAPPTVGPGSGAGSSAWGPLEVAAVVLLGIGGLVVPFVGAAVGLALACASPRWSVRDKVVAAALALLPAVLGVTSFVLPTPALSGPGGWELLLLLLVTGPVAAVYLAVMLSRRAAAPAPTPSWP